MGMISSLEKASVTRFAVYTAISATITIMCGIITYSLTPDRYVLALVIVAGVIWTVMFGLGTSLKLTSGK